MSLTLSTNLDTSTYRRPSIPTDQLLSVAYTLPAEFSSQLSQLSTTCDPSSFMSLASTVSGLNTGVNAPSSCAAAVVGTASASGFAPLAGTSAWTPVGGFILNTSGSTYPLTLWLSYKTPGLGLLPGGSPTTSFAFGGTVGQVGGQTVLTFDTDNAQHSTYSYGFPHTYSQYLAINGIALDFPDSGGAFAATGCATGAWSFGQTVVYAGALQSGLYSAAAPPNDTASASVTCSAPTGGGGGTGGGAGTTGTGAGSTGSTSTGGSGVAGSTTTVPATGKPSAPAAKCVVPTVKPGATLSSVETLLKRAHCATGKIVTQTSANVTRKGKIVKRGVPKGRVIGLADKAGTKLKANTRVGITVSRG